MDPSDWLGDVVLAEVCPSGVDVARYLNHHEDPGGISLALGRDAITSVQRVAVPRADAWDVDWVRDAVAALEKESDVPVPATGKLGRFMRPSSPRAAMGRGLGRALADQMPVNLREQFASAASIGECDDPSRWARRTSALAGLVLEPARVLAELDGEESRQV